ncbi:endonuclease/exonuclease/phosphatase family protein [Nocardia transvalensis]|uniref:endonuclease/exonuclease/phosphatase family protein n=1 Tax=Nocardia transvalensis TaxID=37333 RepID=UPI0018944B58|nr:endonuclease/exonuclease/phosphatase family protein [Nocardia transvalensis]MBF6328191.1 endonuclease/exonuclease/phosphatase family protein [Nocardia transvalensis]
MPAASFRIASYNVENLFSRPRAMNAPADVAAAVLDAHARINELIERETYSAADKTEILRLLKTLRLLRDDGDPARKNTFAVMRKIRGQLLKRPRGGGEDDIVVVAEGRDDFVGFVDLIKDPIPALAVTHTARVLAEVGADIVGVVEAEDRLTLSRFSDSFLRDGGDEPRYPHVMLIDGNDTRGIDVGILATDEYPIQDIRSHIDDGPLGNRIFSRDCPEYRFLFPSGSGLAGQSFVVMVNHLKSKFGGNQSASNRRRRRQAEEVAKIYRRLRDSGTEHVIVLGDFNDTPDSDPLEPLLDGTDLTDIAHVADFDDGDPDEERPGTFGNGTKSNKIDYLLLSPALFARTTRAGIFRKGVWGGVNGTLFPHFDTMTSKVHAASDHAAIYADIDIA